MVVTQSYFSQLSGRSQTYIYIGCVPVYARLYNHELCNNLIDMNSVPVGSPHEDSGLGQPTSILYRSFSEIKHVIATNLSQKNVGSSCSWNIKYMCQECVSLGKTAGYCVKLE